MGRSQFIEIALRRVRPGSGTGAAVRSKRTWSLPVSDLRSVIRQTPFVAVGGVATRLYMQERVTLDVDILVHADSAPALHEELVSAGCTFGGPLSAGGSRWTLPDGVGLDVIESDAAWVRAAVAEPREGPDGLPVIDLPYLVLMKLQAGRTQHLADVSRMLGGAGEPELKAVRAEVRAHLSEAEQDLQSLIDLGRLEGEEP